MKGLGKRMTTAMVVVMLVLAAGCGGSKSNAPNKKAGPAESTEGGGSKLEQGACALVTPEEVSAVLEGTFGAGREVNQDGLGTEDPFDDQDVESAREATNSQCYFEDDIGYSISYRSDAFIESEFEFRAAEGAEAVSDVGDKAIWSGGANLYVLVGKRLIVSTGKTVSRRVHESAKSEIEVSTQLAKLAIARIKQ